MRVHWHFSAEDIIVYGVSAILVINVTRWVATMMANSSSSPVSTVGRALGATVNF